MASFDDVEKIFNQLTGVIFNKTNFTDLSDLSIDILYKRVKSGLGVDSDTKDNPSKRKLKPLKPSTIDARRKKGVRGKFGSPNVSNLTDTGQMLDSMVTKVKGDGYQLLIPNSPRTDGKKNRDVAGYVSENGRPFFALTRDEQTIVTARLDKIVRNEILKLIKKNT